MLMQLNVALPKYIYVNKDMALQRASSMAKRSEKKYVETIYVWSALAVIYHFQWERCVGGEYRGYGIIRVIAASITVLILRVNFRSR